jgi:hypothetical protein
VEPGCYFIDALLAPAMESSNTAKFFDREAISRFKGFGGVRIESDVVLYFLTLKWRWFLRLLIPYFNYNFALCSNNNELIFFSNYLCFIFFLHILGSYYK